MEPSCIRHTEIPGTSALFADFLYGFDRVADFYPANPADPASYGSAAERIDYPDSRRRDLAAALKEINGEHAAIDQLAQPGTVAVVTGQQVGLFSGPCYSIYKALTAAKLARQLTERGIPAVPVFWMATEDHDAEEVNHCWAFDQAHAPVRLSVDTAGFAQRTVGGIPLNDPPLKDLRSVLAGLPFGEEVAGITEAAYAPGRTLGAAFQDLLQRLLSSHGLVFIDPMQPSIRRLAAPMLHDALERMPELVRLLMERNRGLEAAGYHSQVHVEADSSLLFQLEEDRRLPLRRRTGFTADAEHLSPNALLRPVVQDYLLPTVAYVGGPAEIAYLAQSQVLYENLLGRQPVPVPRNGFTILDAHAGKLMERYGLSFGSMLDGRDALRDHIAGTLVPDKLEVSLREARESVNTQVDRHRALVASFDVTLAAALDKSRSKILYQLSRIERKTAHEALRRNQRAALEADYLHHLIFPEKHLQERFYSILPLLAKHGLELVDRLYENVHLDCPDHIVIT